MKKKAFMTPVLLMIFGLIAIISFGLHLVGDTDEPTATPETNDQQATEQTKSEGIAHNPPSLDDVPDGPLGEAILRGYELTNNTSEVLRAEAASVEDGERIVNGLSCTSCHAGAGMDENSSSMVGVSSVYPMYIPRSGKVVTLEDRINGCMVRSMDGEKFPEGSEDLKAMVAYLTYISEGIPSEMNADLPWRHKNSLDDLPTPNVDDGEAFYQQSCIACHAGDGAGTGSNTGPALWGDDSFNDGAGIARMTKMAGYIQNNMPIGGEGTLTDQEASDIAAYILSQDRPEWTNHDKDWPGMEAPTDTMTKERRDQVKDGTINWDEVLGK